MQNFENPDTNAEPLHGGFEVTESVEAGYPGPVAEDHIALDGLKARFHDFTERHPAIATATGAAIDTAAGLAAEAAGKRLGSDEVQAASTEGADLLSRTATGAAEGLIGRNESAAFNRGAGHVALRQVVKAGAAYMTRR